MRPDTKQQYYRRFGARLRKLRRLRECSEQKAAAAAGVTMQTYRRWEVGSVAARNNGWIVDFSKKMDVSYGWLLAGKGPISQREYNAQIRRLKGLRLSAYAKEQIVFGEPPRPRLAA